MCKRDLGVSLLPFYSLIRAGLTGYEMVKYGMVSVPWLCALPITLLLFAITLCCSQCIPQCHKNSCCRITAFILWFLVITLATNANWLYLMWNDTDTSTPAWHCSQ